MPHVHLIGIGGSGLSAIARLLQESGWVVSGSDRQLSPMVDGLQAAGVQVFIGHRSENIANADLVVRSSAISDDNVEVMSARQAGIPVLKRADFLGQLMEGREGIAVAGSHGKTTTTAMIAWMLTALNQDPSFIIGGVSANLGVNARAGGGSAFVIEADEYDHMFLGLRPKIAVVTNVEYDHPDCFPTPEDFHRAFLDFVRLLPADGLLLACTDDPGAARLVNSAGVPSLSYGLERWLDRSCPDYSGRNLQPNQKGGFDFEIFNREKRLAGAGLQVPGRHNVRNALAAIAVAHHLRLPVEAAAQALGEFKGTGRRFEVRGESRGVIVIDDYAHNPTKIRATLAAARDRYPDRRIWAVWQPHTYSRTRTFFDDFAAAFRDADRVIVTEIYAAREAVQPDFSASRVATAIDYLDARFLPTLAETTEFLLGNLREGDVLLVLSAGDADQISGQVLAGLSGEGRQAGD